MDSMTPSVVGMTDGQLDKAADIFRAVLRKHRSEFPSEATQHTLGTNELGLALLAAFRKHVEMFSDMITRCVTVDRTRSPQDAIAATGRNQYVDKDVVAMMPRGEAGEEVDVYFVKADRSLSDDEVDVFLASRGLVPADPYALAAVNEADPAFADEHPNGTHWKDADGKWCFSTFRRWNVERYVVVNRNDVDWNDFWWFAGLRK
jgi:hypothetical protein